MKFYAVRNGRKTGIFLTWEECREQVLSFSGAEYKSFSKKEDAMEYLGGECKEEKKENYAYVDGSYNIETCEFSFGAVMFIGGKTETYAEKYDDPELSGMRNVAGEIKGAEFVLKYCRDNGIGEIDIYHDYEGISAWAEGRWKTNKTGTIAYKKLFDEISKTVKVNFVKVKGHSGDKYNDMADRLAKDAVGVK